MPGHSLHNIGPDQSRLYATTYNALLLSSADSGRTWQSLQNGLPDLYTFHVLTLGGERLAGQWDGIYRRAAYSTRRELYGKGLPRIMPLPT